MSHSHRKSKEVERLVERAQLSIDNSKQNTNELLEASLSFRNEMTYKSPFNLGHRMISTVIQRNLEDCSERFVAAESIEPGRLLFSVHPTLTYPNFLGKSMDDYIYKPIDMRSGIIPKTWVCICCMKAVGSVVPVWCPRCGLPLCDKCGKVGYHRTHDSICDLGRRESAVRFFGIGDILLDVALTRFLLLEAKSEDFCSEIDNLTQDDRVQKVLSTFDTNDLGLKLTPSKVPFAFSAAKGVTDLVRRACAILVTFGNGFYPRNEVGLFHPIFGLFQFACYPNVEIFTNADGEPFEIRAVSFIPKGEYLILDFLQEQLLPTIYRHSFLKSRWNSVCHCARCLDPSEFGTFIGSIKCRSCRRGYLSPNFKKYPELEAENMICDCIVPNDPSHRCKNSCPITVIRQRDVMVKGMMLKVEKSNKLTPLMKYIEYEKLKELTKTICGFHNNYFLVQVMNGYMTSPTAQFVKTVPKTPCVVDFAEFLKNGFQNQSDLKTELDNRFANLEILSTLIDQLTPKYSRHQGYFLFFQAQLEMAVMVACKGQNVKTVFEVCVNRVLQVTPKLIKAWIRILEIKSEIDVILISKITRIFLADPIDEQMRRITTYLRKKTVIGQGHVIHKALADVYSHKATKPQICLSQLFLLQARIQIQKQDRMMVILQKNRRNKIKVSHSVGILDKNRKKNKPIRKSKSRDDILLKKLAIVKYDKKAITEDLLSSFSRVPDEKFYADIFKPLFVSTPRRPSPMYSSKVRKINKLKEALIRREEEQRLLHKQKIKKQLRLLCTGSETEIDTGATASESSLPSPKRKEKYGRSLSAGPPIEIQDEDESILEWTRNGSLATELFSGSETEDEDEAEEEYHDPKSYYDRRRTKATKSHLMVHPIPIHHSTPIHRYRHRNRQQRHHYQKRYRHNGVDHPYVPRSRTNSTGGQMISVVENNTTHEESSQSCSDSQEENTSTFTTEQTDQSMLNNSFRQPQNFPRYTALKYLCGAPPKYGGYTQRKPRLFHYPEQQGFQFPMSVPIDNRQEPPPFLQPLIQPLQHFNFYAQHQYHLLYPHQQRHGFGYFQQQFQSCSGYYFNNFCPVFKKP